MIGFTRNTILFILFLTFYKQGISQPEIYNISGSFVHKSNITITGINFGVKSTAAPRVWDWCDNDSPDDLDVFYPGDRWPKTCSGTPGEEPYLMDYRTSFHGYSTMPHERIHKFICAAATTCSSTGEGSIRGWDTEWSNNVISIPNWDVNKLFIMLYYRMSSTFSESTDEMGGPNLKEISANGPPGGYLDGPDAYRGWCGIPEFVYPEDAYERGIGGSCSSDNRIYTPNPMHDWLHIEWLWDLNTSYFYYSNGTQTDGGENYDQPINTSNPGGTPSSISIGGFSRWPKENETGNYRFWSGIYVDDTYSRIMLGNSSVWEECTIREPQIPVSWNSDSITFTVNLGAFTDNDTKYIYVFNSDNEHNEYGFTTNEGPSKIISYNNVFPNPSFGNVHLNLNLIKQNNCIITIHNILGKVVKKISNPEFFEDEIIIDLSDLPNSIYFIKIDTDSETFINKVILCK